MWRDTAALPEYGRLEGDVRTDVLVIGGGMAGILCAHFLRQAGVDCVLAEADRLCAGATGNTTAKITSQHGLVYDGLLRRFGAEKAGMYLHANEAALARYRGMCREIDCGFEEKDAFVYSLDDRGKLEKELAALEKLGFHAGFTDKLPLPFPVAGAVRFERQAQFDPLRFAAAA
ncbi:MAG: FAD-binding oxidoreductase, partial [Ruthenibacterium lactatiformans]|nr:FAD-binding oxidoreductase [Ruthenibacterium lactatiformans]